VHQGLSLISEPRREQIVKLVWLRERTAGDIAEHLPVTFGAVSQHLKVLLDAGLVSVRKDGRRRWYAANRAAFGTLAAGLEQMWFGKLLELKRLAEAEQSRIDREALTKLPRLTRQHPPKPRDEHRDRRGR
jgi:DNA-binding transcriptional ArsR family regulator